MKLRQHLPDGFDLLAAVIAGFALLTAAGTSEIWVHGFFAADAGTDSRRGLATLAAALLLAIVCGGRAIRRIDERRYFMAAFPLAAVALAMPLWLFTDVIGRADPALAFCDFYCPPAGSTLMGGTGLWMSVAAAACALLALCCQFVLSRRPRPALMHGGASISLAATFAFFAAFGAMSPWSSGAGWSELGVEQRPGLVALAAAAVALAVCWRRARGDISRDVYLAWSAAAGVAMLVAPLYFFATTVGSADPAIQAICIYPCGPSIHAASGLYVSIVAAAGIVATILFDVGRRNSQAGAPALHSARPASDAR